MCPEVFWSKFQKIVLFFKHFITFSREWSYVRPNFFWKSYQNGFLHAQRKYLKEKTFCLKKLKLFFNFGLSAKKFGVLVENIWQGCQNWFLRNWGTFWRIILIQTEPFFYRFRTSSKIFRIFSEAIRMGLSEMQPTFPIDPFGEA